MLYLTHQIALAAKKSAETIIELGKFETGKLRNLYYYAFALVGAAALLMIVIGAIKYMIAGDNMEKVKDAKDTIFSAIAGLLLALCSYIILNTINPELLILKEPEKIAQEIVEKFPLPCEGEKLKKLQEECTTGNINMNTCECVPAVVAAGGETPPTGKEGEDCNEIATGYTEEECEKIKNQCVGVEGQTYYKISNACGCLKCEKKTEEEKLTSEAACDEYCGGAENVEKFALNTECKCAEDPSCSKKARSDCLIEAYGYLLKKPDGTCECVTTAE